MRYDDENVVIFDKDFNNLEECYKYYLGIVHFLTNRNRENALSDKEFKQHRKFVMGQLKANIKLLKSQDKYSRKQEANKLKPPRMKQAEDSAKQQSSQDKQNDALNAPKSAPKLPPANEEKQDEQTNTEIED